MLIINYQEINNILTLNFRETELVMKQLPLPIPKYPITVGRNVMI